MDVHSLIASFATHARVDADQEGYALALMLEAAAQDVAHAAAYSLPADAVELPTDLRFAIVDHATRLYDARGADDIKPGLSLAASRIAARYRGVRIETPPAPDPEVEA